MKVILDAFCMERKAEAHAYLKEKLGFPDYYGNNLDALYDCLTDLGETEVLLINQNLAAGYFKKAYQVIKKASEDNPRFLLKEGNSDLDGFSELRENDELGKTYNSEDENIETEKTEIENTETEKAETEKTETGKNPIL